MIKENMIELIRNGDYSKAANLLSSSLLSTDDMEALLVDMAFETNELTIYSFVSFLISKKETVELHGIAANLMITPLSFFGGAYNVALHHVKRALEIDETNISFMELMILLYMVPDQVIS